MDSKVLTKLTTYFESAICCRWHIKWHIQLHYFFCIRIWIFFCELLQDALIAYHLFNRLEHPKHIWNILRYCDTFSEIFLHLLADLQTKYIFWCILTHSKKSWNILTYSDLFWKMLTFSVILSNLNMPAEKNRVCSDFWWTFKTFFPKLYNYCSNQSIFNAKAPITC